MPIRINLKELFDSDAQEITVDKINFNFNKLLELGIGLPGPTGITGSLGAAGPLGPQGLQGDDGNKWFVGSGNPNSNTFIDLQDNDFYIDVDNSTIYQYDAATNTWELLIDLETVVNNYLAASGATFIRGLGDASPLDNRYILFPNRGNTASDSASDMIGSIATNNDIFYLNNFNETVYNIDNWPAEDVLYDAIQKIHVDFTSGIPQRYHLELGTLYTDPISATMRLTELKHNLKFRHYTNDLSGSAVWAVNQTEPINVGHLSMTTTEAQGLSQLDYNSMFEFLSSKYNTDGLTEDRVKFITRIGPREAIGESNNGNRWIDGISFGYDGFTSAGTIGIAIDLGSTYSWANYNAPDRYISVPGLERNYLMIKGDSVDGVLIDGNTFQNDGNIEQIGAGTPHAGVGSLLRLDNDPQPELDNQFGNTSIIVVDNEILACNSNFTKSNVNGDPVNNSGGCTIARYGIGGDKDSPINLNNASFGSAMSEILPQGTVYDTGTTANPTWNNNNGKRFHGANLADMKSDGKYIYSVHNAMRGSVKVNMCDPNAFTRTYFQVAKINPAGFQGIGHVNDYLSSPVPSSPDQTVGSQNSALSGAWRLELDGDVAYVATNNLKDWGHDTFDFTPYSLTNIMFPNDSVNNMGLAATIIPIGISDPENPQAPSLNGIIGLEMAGSNLPQSHHMDMCSDSKRLYTLTLELGTKSGGGGDPTPGYAGDGSCCQYTSYNGNSIPSEGCAEVPGGTAGSSISFDGYKVSIHAFTKSCLSDDNMAGWVSHQAESNALWDTQGTGATINRDNYKQLGTMNHFGTIDTDGTYIYAAFGNTLKIAQCVSEPLGVGEAWDTPTQQINDLTALWAYTDYQNVQATDCKLVGNSLYILHTSNIMDNQNQYSGTSIGKQMCVTKVDVKSPSNPKKLWTHDLTTKLDEALAYCTRFVIVGNNIYLSQGNQNDLFAGQGGLLTLELDGIESDHINAGEVSADSIHTIDAKIGQNLEVHGSANIGNSVNVGCSLSTNDLNVTGNMTVNGMPSGMSSPVGTIVAYVGEDEPVGWLKMNGQTFNASGYPELVAIGTPLNWVTSTPGKWGGTLVEITLPDLANRYLMGTGGGGYGGGGLGHLGGNDAVNTMITEANLPPHTHLVEGNTYSDGAHTHTIPTAIGGSGMNRLTREADNASTLTLQAGGTHSHEINLLTSSDAQSSDLEGNAITTSIVPLNMEVHWIIKALPGF